MQILLSTVMVCHFMKGHGLFDVIYNQVLAFTKKLRELTHDECLG